MKQCDVLHHYSTTELVLRSLHEHCDVRHVFCCRNSSVRM